MTTLATPHTARQPAHERAVRRRAPGRTSASVGARIVGPPTRARVLAFQRDVGNAAVATLLQRGATSAACTGDGGCHCGCASDEETTEPRAATVQRQPPGGPLVRPGDDPFGLGPKGPERLKFTDRWFPDQTLPTVCPRCHRDTPPGPQLPRLLDRDATEPRLVTWAQESERSLHIGGTTRMMQLDPAAIDPILDDYGVGLTKRITSSNEFDGSPTVRDGGVEIVRRRWPDIRPPVRDKLAAFYQNELMRAVGRTPKGASPVLRPDHLRSVLTTRHGGTVQLGRHGATAKPGDQVGSFKIHDATGYVIWLTHHDDPLWLYVISGDAFIRHHDPFVADVYRRVYDNTKWILELMPFLLKVGAFALGFSGSIAYVITAIVLDEFATEMQADVKGQPRRTPGEILGSAGTQLLVDRIFHGLLGGTGGKAAAGAAKVSGKLAGQIDAIAEKAVPAIRAELANAEKPLVKQALDAGAARRVTDQGLKAQGYTVEVAIHSGGQRHVFRLNSKGRWCRFSATVCDLDLGADVVAAAKAPASFTKGRLEETRGLMTTIESEISFLTRFYERTRSTGRVDLSLLSAQERAMLDEIVPSGDASKLTLRELRDLPRSQGLAQQLKAAADEELALVRQLYREGRPLHEIMRAASPSFASRSRVLREAAGRDAATGAVPRSGALHVDHVVPLNEIVRMDGFARLRPERQLEIVNDVKNLRAIDSLANSSKGDRSWQDWARAAIHYDPGAIARMRVLEAELKSYLAGRIAALLRP